MTKDFEINKTYSIIKLILSFIKKKEEERIDLFS
jgi:hypothetical protein